MTWWSEGHGILIQSTHTTINFETKRYINKRKEGRCVVKKEENTSKDKDEIEGRPVG